MQKSKKGDAKSRNSPEMRAGGPAAYTQAEPPAPAAAHRLDPAARPSRGLIDEARMEAIADYLRSLRFTAAQHIEFHCTGRRPYEFYQSERGRLKWLMRLPDDYDFATNEYRWALSSARRAGLPPAVESSESEVAFTGPFGIDNPNRLSGTERNVRRLAVALAHRHLSDPNSSPIANSPRSRRS